MTRENAHRSATRTVVRLPLVVLAVALSVLGCAPSYDHSVSAGDLVYGKYPGNETVLRLKSSCAVPSDDGAAYMLPAGDYDPVAADSGGLFYEAPSAVELRQGDHSVLLSGLGIYLPLRNRGGAPPSLWTEGVSLERGTLRRVRRSPLPNPCWNPDGGTLSVIHKGLEVAPQ